MKEMCSEQIKSVGSVQGREHKTENILFLSPYQQHPASVSFHVVFL